MMYSAEELSKTGDQYIGQSYKKMDCQAFVERCMKNVGYDRDLGGSNSWYRECLKHGWAGTPEECLKEFGFIPNGALLFIWQQVSASTPDKFQNDGIGDIIHMGIVTHRNDGAIHSSSTRGCVATSIFKDKTIPNGGWNRIGLLAVFDYGKSINWILYHGRKPVPSTDQDKGVQKVTEVIIQSKNGGWINLREKKSQNSMRVDKIPSGSHAEMLEGAEGWCRIRYGNYTGWVMSEFVFADDSDIPSEDPVGPEPSDGQEGASDDSAMDLLVRVYKTLKTLCAQIEDRIAKG